MGFCYSYSGLLCCDFCSKAGGVRKIKCPYDYCQAYATCPACRTAKKHKQVDHARCKEAIEKAAMNLAKLKAGGMSLAVKTVESAREPGKVFYRFIEWGWYSAACDIFRKTWMDEPELAYFRGLGHTLNIYPLGQEPKEAN